MLPSRDAARGVEWRGGMEGIATRHVPANRCERRPRDFMAAPVPHTANSGTTDGRTCHGAVAHIGSRLVVDADSTMFQALSERRVAQIHCSVIGVPAKAPSVPSIALFRRD